MVFLFYDSSGVTKTHNLFQQINEFRFKMSFLTETYSMYRQNLTLAEKLNYQYPPRLRPELQNDKLTSSFKERYAKKNEDNKIMLVARYENDENCDNSGTFKVPSDATPAEVLACIFNHNAFKMKKEDTEYILKVYGQDEYIYGDRPIIDYLYVQVSFRRTLSDGECVNASCVKCNVIFIR